MAGPAYVSYLVAGRNTGVTEMTQANASVGASQLNCGSSGTVSIVALVARPGTNNTSSAAIDYVRVGGIDLTASESIRTLGGYSTGTMRAFAGRGLSLTGNQNWAVGQNAGDSWGWEVIFIVFDGDATITYSVQADVLINNGDTHTKSISSNSNSTIVEAFFTTYNTTTFTGQSGATVVQSNAFVLGDGVGVYGPGSTGSVSSSPNATEIIIGGAWNLEGASAAPVLTGSITLDNIAPTGSIVSLPTALTGNITLDDVLASGSAGLVPGSVQTLPFSRNTTSRPLGLTGIALAVLSDNANLTRISGTTSVNQNPDGTVSFSNGALPAVGTSVIVLTRESDGTLGVERYTVQ